MTMKLNPGFWNKMKQLDNMVEQGIENQLQRFADAAIDNTLGNNDRRRPAVDTGAYITSFSITYGRGRPRGKSSRGKQRKNPDILGLSEVGRANLYNDIGKLDLLNTERVTLRNNSPHAVFVEYKHAYYIFAKLEREFNG